MTLRGGRWADWVGVRGVCAARTLNSDPSKMDLSQRHRTRACSMGAAMAEAPGVGCSSRCEGGGGAQWVAELQDPTQRHLGG